mgnify:CR=1 FL=1
MPDLDDAFDFSRRQTDASRGDDGSPDSLWLDLDYPIKSGVETSTVSDGADPNGSLAATSPDNAWADDGPTCDPAANPVLIVVADSNDFYY